MLEIRDLTLSYGERVALRDVSLSLAKGELLGVVGPNASGKSSLIRAITDVVTPQRGEVRLGGSLVRRLSRRGVVPGGGGGGPRPWGRGVARPPGPVADALTRSAREAHRGALRWRATAGGGGSGSSPGGASPASGRAHRPSGRGASGGGSGAAAAALPHPR